MYWDCRKLEKRWSQRDVERSMEDQARLWDSGAPGFGRLLTLQGIKSTLKVKKVPLKRKLADFQPALYHFNVSPTVQYMQMNKVYLYSRSPRRHPQNILRTS